MHVQPLVCAACSGAVPLGDGAAAKCPYCAAEVPIPDALLKLRDDDQEQVKARAFAAERLAELGAQVPLPIRVMAVVGDAAIVAAIVIFGIAFLLGFIAAVGEFGHSKADTTAALIAAVVIAIVAVPLAWEWILHALANKLHVDVVDRLSGFGAHLLLGVFITLFMIVPIALGIYADGFTNVRQRLQRTFASKPPHRPGGPATCRKCNAPLDVPAGAFGVRCVFCGTDNLVAISAKTLATATHAADEAHENVDAAWTEEHAVRREGRKNLRTVGIVCLVMIPMCGGIGVVAEKLVDSGGATGHTTRASGPPMLYGEGPKRAPGDVVLDCGECEFYVPLKHGQTISAPGALIERRELGHWYHLDWDWTELEPGPVRYTGWYRIRIVAKKPDQKLHWSVD